MISSDEHDPTIDADEPGVDDGPSRSARKREADAVRELGRRLAELAPGARASVPLGEDVREAIEHLNTIRRGSAHKRQLSYLAKRLRQLQRKALADRAAGRPPAAARELFRLVRDTR